MKTRILDSPASRISVAVAVLAGLILIGAGAYTFFGMGDNKPVDGMKIISAAHNYTRFLIQNQQPIPQAVSLQVLVDKGFLQPADIGPFQGLKAAIALTKRGSGPSVLMRVQMPDGMDLVLFEDGVTQKIKR